MERTLMSRLLQWQSDPQRKPLLLRGPRQVGKTWLLRRFGSDAYENTVYVNFEADRRIGSLFDDSTDVNRLIHYLTVAMREPITPGATLLILDEIQECNAALNALKYFCEDAPRIHVAAAGSLLGVALSRPGAFPVGKVDFLDLEPLTFSEYLSATGHGELRSLLDSITSLTPLPEVFAEALTQELAGYFIVGGMPEAVARFAAGCDLEDVARVQGAILDAYRLDAARHAPGTEVQKIGHLWDSIPAQLARANKKFLYGAAREGARARGYENALHWLAETRAVSRVERCTVPAPPLAACVDPSAFKLYLYDTGLLSRHARFDPGLLIEPAAPFDVLRGALTENYVLQSLRAQFEQPICYWTSGGEAEVDFVVQRGGEVLPIEAKARVNVRAKSLAVFRQKYKPRVAVRTSLRNLQFRDGLLDLPLYMADHLDRLVDAALGMVV